MKVGIYDLNGKIKGKIDLPDVFKMPFRPDLIKRAVLALQSQKRQPYGTDIFAGMRTSAHYHGKRRYRYTMMNRDIARLPRLHATSPHLHFRAREVPQAVKGRRAHPPKVEKKWEQKINKKEKMLALVSAISATANRDIVKERGHKIEKVKELPIILDDSIQKVSKTKEFEKILDNLGLSDEIRRCKVKKERPGKGKMRGRRYKRKKGPLIVIEKDEGVLKAASNIPGVDVNKIDLITIEDLAPGAHPGRLIIWSKSAIERLREF